MPSNAAMKRYNYLIAEIESVYHEAALRFGMSDSALMILYVLCGQDGACALADLPYFTGLSKQTLNSAVRKLEAEGTIESVAVGARKKELRLTEAGRALCAKTVERLIEAENALFETWEPAERQLYLTLTKRYLDMIRDKVNAL